MTKETALSKGILYHTTERSVTDSVIKAKGEKTEQMNDSISRQSVLNILLYFNPPQHLGMIKKLPSADVQPVRHGRWIEEPNCMYRCSSCGSHYPSIKGYMDYCYCPSCGARMDGE